MTDYRVLHRDITLSREWESFSAGWVWTAELDGQLRPGGPVVHITVTGDTASEALEAMENLIRANGWRVSDV